MKLGLGFYRHMLRGEFHAFAVQAGRAHIIVHSFRQGRANPSNNHHTYEKGWAGARQSHLHHQTVYAVRGRTGIQAQGNSWGISDGDSMVVAGSVDGEASAFEPSEALDASTPFRRQYV